MEDALDAGFRAIDTANQRKHYFEAGVGQALKKAWDSQLLRREDLFLQTKFTSLGGQDHRLPYDPQAKPEDQVQQSFASSLEHLHTNYLDSYVLHGPTHPRVLAEHDWEVWRAMEDLHRQQKTKHLGISNVRLEQLVELCGGAEVQPTFVQNRCFARMGWDREIREFCSNHQITYQGFSLLTANPEVFQNPKFQEILGRLGCTPAQLVFQFALQSGMAPLTGTTDPAHMREDLEASHFALNAQELLALATLSE